MTSAVFMVGSEIDHLQGESRVARIKNLLRALCLTSLYKKGAAVERDGFVFFPVVGCRRRYLEIRMADVRYIMQISLFCNSFNAKMYKTNTERR